MDGRTSGSADILRCQLAVVAHARPGTSLSMFQLAISGKALIDDAFQGQVGLPAGLVMKNALPFTDPTNGYAPTHSSRKVSVFGNCVEAAE